MIQAGFSTLRDPRTSQANSNGTDEKARRSILRPATDMTTKQNGSSHQDTTAVNGKKADHSTDTRHGANYSFGVGPVQTLPPGDAKVDWPSSNENTVNVADTHTANDQKEIM